MNSTYDSRLDELEEKASFQEDALQQLNNALVGQQVRIDQLEKTVQMLTEQLRSLGSDQASPEDEPPPPHY